MNAMMKYDVHDLCCAIKKNDPEISSQSSNGQTNSVGLIECETSRSVERIEKKKRFRIPQIIIKL